MNRCRGTFRMRSSTRGSEIPCSCRRCTRRSRVRADVMPIPLRRGPSMKLLKLEPFRKFRQRRMTRQIDLQRGNGRKPFGHGMEIRAGSCVLTGPGIAHPVYVAASGILGLDDRLAAMPAAEAGHLDAAQLALGQIRNIDVENDGAHLRPLQPLLSHSTHELSRDLRGGCKIARAARLDTQRD